MVGKVCLNYNSSMSVLRFVSVVQ